MNYKDEIIKNCKYRIRLTDKFIDKYLDLPKDFFEVPLKDDMILNSIASSIYNHNYSLEHPIMAIGYYLNNDISLLLIPTITTLYNDDGWTKRKFDMIIYGWVCNTHDIREYKDIEQDNDETNINFYRRFKSVKFLDSYQELYKLMGLHHRYVVNILEIIFGEGKPKNFSFGENFIFKEKEKEFSYDNLIKHENIDKYMISELIKLILLSVRSYKSLNDKINNIIKCKLSDKSKKLDKDTMHIICTHKDFRIAEYKDPITQDELYFDDSYYEMMNKLKQGHVFTNTLKY